jgi:hypothetical protein
VEVKPVITADHSPVRPWLSPDPGLTEDEEVTLAMGDPLAFATKFAEAVVASGLDTDELAASGPGNAVLDAGLEKRPMGELPEDDEHDVPQDTMIGFRSMGGTLRRRRRRKARAYDVHWRHCRVNINCAHGVAHA